MIKSPIDKFSDTFLVEEFDSSEVISLYQDNFGIDVSEYFTESKFQLRECSKTNYRFFHPKHLEGKEKLYDDLHTHRPSYYRFPKWEHLSALNITKKLNVSNVLEIGCATGDFISYLSKNLEVSVAGIELNTAAAKIGREKKLEIYDEVVEEHLKRGKKYDIICSFQVVEHIYDIHSLFTHSIDLLNKGGYIIFGVPHSNPYLYYFDKFHTLNLPPHHVGLWDKKTIKNIAKHFNLDVIDIQIEKPSSSEIDEIVALWSRSKQRKFRIAGWIAKAAKKTGRVFHMEKFLNIFLREIFKGRNIIGVLKKKK